MFCSKYAFSTSSISFCTVTPKLYIGRLLKLFSTAMFSLPMAFSYTLYTTLSDGST